MENEDNNISEERSIISYLAQISQGSSADNESYQLSIDQMMDEYTEFDQDMSTNESPTTKQEELDNLVKEGQAPIEDILLQYKDYFEERDSIMNNPNEVDLERRRRYMNRRNYDENVTDFEEFVSLMSKKAVLIGPQFQVDVPDQPTYDSFNYVEQFEEVLYDPYTSSHASFEEFFYQLRNSHLDIRFEDENVWALYMKHQGNIYDALQDTNTLFMIEETQSMPLIDWSIEELFELKNAFLKCGKNFIAIRDHFYPNRSIQNIVNTYYTWKKSPLYKDYRSLIHVSINDKFKEDTTEETEIQQENGQGHIVSSSGTNNNATNHINGFKGLDQPQHNHI